MNRNDEFIELKQKLEQTPVEFEYTAMKAVLRVKQQQRRSLLWKTPLVSLCTISVIFVLLVHLFPAVAIAMSNVPILKNLVHAVAFDPSLKLAVEHDYFQMIGQSLTQEDVTVTVEYMILDAGHISLFFSVDSPVKAGTFNFELLDPEGNCLTAVLISDLMYNVGQLEEIKIEFAEGNYSIPKELTFHVTINKDENTLDLSTDLENTGVNNEFSFNLYPNETFSLTVNTLLINQWVELKSQKIYLERLDVYPTQARLYFHCDDNNSSILKDLDIYFEDDKGVVYGARKNGLTGTGSPDSLNLESLYFESSYFAEADQLKMYIKGISIVGKDKLYDAFDYSKKTITNLPEGVTVDTMTLKGSTLSLTLKAYTEKLNKFNQIIDSTYFDYEGNEYFFGSWTSSTTDGRMPFM